jgi:HEXXH motif-containing protein
MEGLVPPVEAPWLIPALQSHQLATADNREWLTLRPSEPPLEVRRELEQRGLHFLTPDERTSRQPNLNAASNLIDAVPALANAVREHVRGVTVLRAEEAYDISHSEPRWSDWIFVSVPAALSEQSALRAAENVVHEAMHLQLTRLETLQPLIADEAAMIDSPWKQEPRDLKGILHGLYVFICIYRFLEQLRALGKLGNPGVEYVDRRKSEISEELAMVEFAQLRAGLTTQGRALLLALTAPLRT